MFFVLLHLLSAEPIYRNFYAKLEPGKTETFTLKEGMILMMVTWPNAVLYITLNSKKYAFTVADGYSMFAFKDDATITIDNTLSTIVPATYYGFTPPALGSTKGYHFFISNLESWQKTDIKSYGNLFIVMYGKYKIDGLRYSDLNGHFTVHYNDWFSPDAKHEDCSNLDSPLMVTGPVIIENPDSSKYIYNTDANGLKMEEDELIPPSIPFSRYIPYPYQYTANTKLFDDNYACLNGEGDDKNKKFSTLSEASTTSHKFVVKYYAGDFYYNKVKFVQGTVEKSIGSCSSKDCSAEFSTSSPVSLKISVSNILCSEKVLFSGKPTADKTYDLQTNFPTECGTSVGNTTTGSSSQKSNKGAIIAVCVVVPIVVLAGVGVGIFFFLKKKNNGGANEDVNPSV